MPEVKPPSKGRRADMRPGQYFRLHLAGEERSYPDLLDVGAFLFDLTTLYEVIRLGIQNPDYEFTRFTLYRNRNRLPQEKLFLEALRHESPLDLSALFLTVGSGAATAWALFQVFDKLWNLPLNRRKLLAEVEKAERENAKAAEEDQARRVLRRLEAAEERSRVLPLLEDRLRASPVKVSKADVEAVEMPPPNDGHKGSK